jgi:hypothetical protein
MPADPTPHGATAAGGDTPHGFQPGKAGGFRSGDAPQTATTASPMNFSTMPPWRSTIPFICSK